jgi:hypothetical protein
MLNYCNACACNHSGPTDASTCGTSGFTAADLRALESAIASGALKVKYRDQEVQYGSVDDLMRRYQFVQGQVCGTANPNRSVRVTQQYNSGLGCHGGGSDRYFDRATY